MQMYKYANMQSCKYAHMQIFKFASMQVYAKYIEIYANCYFKLWSSEAKQWPDLVNLLEFISRYGQVMQNLGKVDNYAK